MKPGRELDALVAEKVMGDRTVNGPLGHLFIEDKTSVREGAILHLPRYSTDISAAWEIIIKKDFAYTLGNNINGSVYCSLLAENSVEATGESAPIAICLAALKAVGELP